MQIRLNGEEKNLDDGLTVAQLLDELQIKGPLAVEINQEICPKTSHQNHQIKPNDVLEIVTIVGGG